MITVEVFGRNKENNEIVIEDTIITNGDIIELHDSRLLEGNKYTINASNTENIIVKVYIVGNTRADAIYKVREFINSL